MTFKQALDIDCGIRYMYNSLHIMSSCGRKLLLSTRIMTVKSEIEDYYHFLNEIYNHDCTQIVHRLMSLRDIATTISRLGEGATLSDVELFEIKHLAMLSQEIASLLHKEGISSVRVPQLHEVIELLDPDNTGIATFYIYDSYSDALREVRKLIKQLQGDGRELSDTERVELATLLQKNADIELDIRERLSHSLQAWGHDLEVALHTLSHLDILTAKAQQIREMNLCFPLINIQGETHYKGMFNPAVKHHLAEQGRDYMPVDITFTDTPVTIIGANMGGKSVVLRTLALNQLLTQYGWGVAATCCNVNIVEDVSLCMGDEQSIAKGVSSFAAEILAIDEIIRKIRDGKRILALVDEPARTTNPIEGTALVEGLLQTIGNVKGAFILTTHYNISNEHVQRYRVRGLKDGVMDYTLQATHCGEVPHEAITIAESLGIDAQWIEYTKNNINNK